MISKIILLITFIFINGFFSAIEMAFVNLNDNKIKRQAEEGDKKAQKILKLLKTPSKFLATIQIGITLAGFLSSALASATFVEPILPVLIDLLPMVPETIISGAAVFIVTLILSYFSLVLGELVPKRIGMKYCEQLAAGTVSLITVISTIAKPFVWLLSVSANGISSLFGIQEAEDEHVTEEEIRMMVDVGEETGTIEPEEKEMINNIFELNDTIATEIMVPRIDIVAVDRKATVSEIIKILDEAKFSRIPVYDDTIDNIVGVLNIKELISYIGNKKHFTTTDVMREPFFVPETKKVHDLFKEMQKNQCSLAIVLDEYGGTSGIISMEDILEEIVGNIFDEYDEVEEEYEKIDENTFEIEGSIVLDDAADVIGVNLPEGDYDTLGGFLIDILGRIPEDDEKPIIEYENLIFQILEYEEKRIGKIKVTRKVEESI